MKKDNEKFASLWNNTSLPLQWSNTKMWAETVATNTNNQSLSGNTVSAGGFWEEPSKSPGLPKTNTKSLTKCQTVANMQSHATTTKSNSGSAANVAASTTSNNKTVPGKPVPSSSSSSTAVNNNALSKKSKANASKKANTNNNNSENNEFTNWCSRALAAHVDVIDGKSLSLA